MEKKYRIIVLLTLIVSLFGIQQLFSDGFIIVKRDHRIPHFRPFPLSVKYHHVDVKIFDRVAVTKIDQVFFNSTRRRLEGFYMFPVPEGAVIKNFSMYINGKDTKAELLGAKKARRIYEDIVRKMRDPALLEYSGKRLFKVRIFPIEPMSEKRIKISYSEILKKEGKTVEYIYPLNTEKFSSVPIKEVSIRAEVNSSENIGNIYCPTHKTEIIRKNAKNAVMGFEASNAKPDRDFKFYFDYGKDDMSFSLKTFRKNGEEGFFFLNITPSIEAKQSEILPKDVVFVLDVSGSMSGKKIEQAKRALKFCINNLRDRDRFNIVRFSTEAETLFASSLKADRKNRKRAIGFVDGLRAIGGTNIFEALDLALKDKEVNFPRRTVIFITDGRPTIGITSETELIKKINKKNKTGVRIFTFGIGNDINTHLLDKLTEMTGAYRTYITPDEDIEIKISRFFTKIESPVLTDLKLKFDRTVKILKMYPEKIPDLFRGSSLSLIGRFKGSGKSRIVLEGKIVNRIEKFLFYGNFKKDDRSSDYIPKLWASRRVGFLLDQIRLNGEDKELRDEVIRVARKYGIVTPYTSYLIVEDEKVSVARREIRDRDRFLAPSVISVKKFSAETGKEHSALKAKSGALSVRASREVQQMYSASDYSQADLGSDRIPLKKIDGKVQGINSIVKNVGGRAFYYNGNFWVDSLTRTKKKLKILKVKFSSENYFRLLDKYPSVSKFLSLGRNVKFIFNNTLYEIEE